MTVNNGNASIDYNHTNEEAVLHVQLKISTDGGNTVITNPSQNDELKNAYNALISNPTTYLSATINPNKANQFKESLGIAFKRIEEKGKSGSSYTDSYYIDVIWDITHGENNSTNNGESSTEYELDNTKEGSDAEYSSGSSSTVTSDLYKVTGTSTRIYKVTVTCTLPNWNFTI